MIVSFPLPGYIAKLTQTVQIEKMKKVGPMSSLISFATNCFVQADARVQTVTESKITVFLITSTLTNL